MLLAAAFALAFHGLLLTSQCAWLLPESPTAALPRSVKISLTPAPSTPEKPAPASTPTEKKDDKPPPEAPFQGDNGKKPAPPVKKEKPPAPKPAPAVQETPVEAHWPEPTAKTEPVVEATPSAQFSSLFDSVRSSSNEPLIPEGIAELSKDAEASPSDAKETNAPRGAVEDAGPALTEARPLYRRNPPPEYPRLARRRGYQGTVLLDVLVDKTGRVKELRVEESSGHGSLDRAAKRAVKGWRFSPGRRGDDPVDMWVKVPVRYELK
jgi:protein TonB